MNTYRSILIALLASTAVVAPAVTANAKVPEKSSWSRPTLAAHVTAPDRLK